MAGDNSPSQAPRREGWIADSGHREEPAGAVSSRSAAAPVAALESDIRLTLPARPENVAVVRHVLDGLAEALDLPRAVTEDIRLAVTEACANVVRHAYAEGEGEGTIEVVVRPKGAGLEVIVADFGRGIGQSLDTAGPGLGLPLIAALADSLEIDRRASAGSRLVMSFLRTPAKAAMGLS
jgi:anti-sigma regulatory factor (Ser/Thr protein kinase)